MTAPCLIPAVAVRPLPSCCWLCGGDRQVLCRPVGETTSTLIPCPHCTAPDGLWALIEVAW